MIKVVLCARGESEGTKLVEELNAKGMIYMKTDYVIKICYFSVL